MDEKRKTHIMVGISVILACWFGFPVVGLTIQVFGARVGWWPADEYSQTIIDYLDGFFDGTMFAAARLFESFGMSADTALWCAACTMVLLLFLFLVFALQDFVAWIRKTIELYNKHCR